MPNPATLVHIAVKDQGGGKYDLNVFPIRRGDTVAFGTRQHAQPSAQRPREVVWEGHDIPAGMKLRIVVKPAIPNDDKALLPAQAYEILANNSSVNSGAVQLKPGDQGGTWKYDIFLVDAAGAIQASIDPDVDVHPDP